MKAEREQQIIFKEQEKIVNDYLESRNKLLDTVTPYKPETKIEITETDLPFKTVHAGDIHYGHDHANPKALDTAISAAGDKGLLVLQGNIIDGVSGKFIRNNTTQIGFDLDVQEYIVRNKLKPIVEEERIVVVGKNTCHEGWAEKTATHDPTRSLVGEKTPLIFTGGQIKFTENGKQIGNLEVYHNCGKGRTKQSPEGSVRERSRETPIGHPDRPNALIDAHMHQLVAAQDVTHNPVTAEDTVTTLGQVGAAKGTKEKPDDFLIGLGVPPRLQPADCGQGLTLIWKKDKSGNLKNYPITDYSRADIVYNAELIWEKCQKTGTYKELREKIEKDSNCVLPEVRLIKKGSIKRKNDEAATSEGKAPLYKVLNYNLSTNLPVKIQFIGNIRMGSSSLDRKMVNRIIEETEKDPWSFMFLTRRLINQGISKSGNRKETLKNLSKLFGTVDDSILGLMLTDELRSSSWSKDVKKSEDKISEGFYPGDWLYYKSDIKGTPLILPETVVRAKIGKIDYTMLLRDKLSHFTSLINPYHGLSRIKDIWGIDADVLVGGHTEVVGWRTWMRPYGQTDIIVPGGFSEYIEKGVGNRVDSVKGGQGVILFPNKKRFYSFATHDDGKDLHQALWLREGLKNWGIIKKVMKK